MNYYYHIGDDALYPVGHTPEVLFNKLYVSEPKIEFDNFSIRIQNFMNRVIAHHMILFIHPGSMAYELSVGRDKLFRSRTSTMLSLVSMVEDTNFNPKKEMAMIESIKATGEGFRIMFYYLPDYITTRIIRKQVIDDYLKDSV